MLLATHALNGAFIGKIVPNPFFAFLLGILSHFIIDLIPHRDFPDYKEGNDVPSITYNKTKISWNQLVVVSINIFLTIATLVYLYMQGGSPSYFAGAFGAILPDLPEDFPYIKYRYKTWSPTKFVHNIHCAIQKYKPPYVLGMFIQYATGIIFFFLL